MDTLGGRTQFSYDANGNLVSVTDAAGNTTSSSYDAANRVLTRTDPLNVIEHLSMTLPAHCIPPLTKGAFGKYSWPTSMGMPGCQAKKSPRMGMGGAPF